MKKKNQPARLLLRSCQIINPHELTDEELMKHEHTNVLELFYEVCR
ncbi:MAG: hypothetical protein AAF392_03010 [Bacteroidota bacterium]